MTEKETPQYYLECLRQDLAKAVGRRIDTYTDFNYLYLELKKVLKEAPSVSTLKRLWAYVPTSSERSRTTLNALVRFLGFETWKQYIDHVDHQNQMESGFFGVMNVVTSSLAVGDRLEITWKPDRIAEVEYNGDNYFTVVRSENSKLKEGSRFSALLFTMGLPLVCSDVTVDGENLGTYIAGIKSGLSSIRIIKE